MKKILCLFLCLIMGFALASCGGNDDHDSLFNSSSSLENCNIEYYAVLNGEKSSIPPQMYDENGNYPNSYMEGVSVTIDNLQTECKIDNYTFIFEGWFIDEACQTPFAGITASTRGKLTIYAKISTEESIKPIEYYAIVDKQKTSIPVQMYQAGKGYPVSYEQGISITIDDLVSEYTFETGIWTFEGWFLDEACQTAFTGITAQTTGKVTLYAKIKNTPIFAINYYMVTDDGKTSVPANMYKQDGSYPIKYIKGKDVKIDDLLKETQITGGRRIFICWYTDEACQVPFISITEQTTGTVTLYAKCVDQFEYKIKYKAITQSGKEKDITQYLFEEGKEYPDQYYSGVGAKVDNLKPRYDGANQEWVFYGWYLDKALTIAFDGTIDVTQRGEIVLYAKVDYASWTSNY